MEAVAPIVRSTGEHNSFKMSFKEVAISLIGEDKYYRCTEPTRKVIDYLIYLGTKKGFAYPSQEHIVAKYNVSLSSVKRAVKMLKDAGVITTAYRRLRGYNAKGGAVYFLTNHPYYLQWKDMLNLKAEPVDNLVIKDEIEPFISPDELSSRLADELSEKAETSWESKAEEGKKSSNLLELVLNKLRDLINTSIPAKKVDSLNVLTVDQKEVMDKIQQATGIKQFWVDNAFECAKNSPKKMTAIEKQAVDYTIKEMMIKDTDVHNAGGYFKSACKSRNLRATRAVNMFNQGYSTTSNNAIEDVPFYNWLEA